MNETFKKSGIIGLLLSIISIPVSEANSFTTQVIGQSNESYGASWGDFNGGSLQPVEEFSSDSTPRLRVGDVLVDEFSGMVDVVVTLIPPNSSDSVSLQYNTQNGTATVADNDYSPVSDSLLFLANKTQQTVSIPTINDGDPETTEFFTLELQNSVNASIADGSGMITTKSCRISNAACRYTVLDQTRVCLSGRTVLARVTGTFVRPVVVIPPRPVTRGR